MLVVSSKKDFIASVPMALSFPEALMKLWKKEYPPSSYQRGNVLFYRGHRPYGVFLVFEGAIDLVVSKTDPHPMLQIGSGSLLGLPPAIAEKPYSCTAVVKDDALISFVSKQQLKRWIKEQKNLIPKELLLLQKKKI